MKKPKATTFAAVRQVLWNLLLIAAGSVVCSIAVNGILIRQGFFGAGFTGVSLLLHYLFPTLPVSGIYFVLNLPLFALGWKHVGHRFFLYSIAGMLLFSAALAWTHVTVPPMDKTLNALFAGIIMGVGSGLILRSLGSAGGLDILSVIFLKLFSLRLGTTILTVNSVILLAGALLFSLEGALYTLIYVFVNSFIVDFMVTGLSRRRAVFIISSSWERISQAIMENIQRGVTILDGRGAYSGNKMQILYTVISFQEVPRLKRMVRQMDPDAFVVVSDTLEVMGTRIGNQPHW